MGIRTWLIAAVTGLVIAGAAGVSPAAAGTGSVSMSGGQLKIKGENTKISDPGDTPEWRRNFIAVVIANPTHRGWDGTPAGVDVTGMLRAGDLSGGSLFPGAGCIHGMSQGGNEQNTIAYCDPTGFKKISIKTGNGNDSVWIENADPVYSIPATVSSTITTGKGHDGVWGGNGPDKINTGNDNDGGTDDGLGGPESVNGFGGNDQIVLGNGDTFASEDNPLFVNQKAYGGEGNDRISAGGFFSFLYGEGGDDILLGGKFPDTLVGGQGADTMKGGNGNDTLDATEVPAQADLLIDCGKDGSSALLDVGVDPPAKNCI